MVPFSRVRQQAIRNLLSATLVLLAVTTVLGTRTIPVTIAIDVIVALTAHVCHEHIIYKPSQQQYKPGQTTKSEQAPAATNSKLLIGKVKAQITSSGRNHLCLGLSGHFRQTSGYSLPFPVPTLPGTSPKRLQSP